MNPVDARLRAAVRPLPFPWQSGAETNAAVLVPFCTVNHEECLVFTVRHHALAQHAGQVSFPGGRCDNDLDPVACALRETHEEIGVARPNSTAFGHLGTRISSSNYRVHCVVGRIQHANPQDCDPHEVARLLIVPLRSLLQLDRWHERQPTLAEAGRVYLPSPHFEVGNDLIWGLTGRFTYDLVTALQNGGTVP